MSDAVAACSGSLACRRCDKRFTRPENLARHLKTHNSVQKHRCQTCGRQFTRSDLRKKHELLHERTTPARAIKKPRRATRRNSPPRDSSLVQTLDTLPNLSSTSDQVMPVWLSGEDSTVLPRVQAESTLLDASFIHTSCSDPLEFNPYFDYATFAKPWNSHLDETANRSDWFSSQFFAALRETDLAYSPAHQVWSTNDYAPNSLDVLDVLSHDNAVVASSVSLNENTSSMPNGDRLLQTSPSSQEDLGGTEDQPYRLSRAASPPNESSREDGLPFAWDPQSKAVARAKPIALPVDDPIFAKIDPKVGIDQATLARIHSFLTPEGLLTGEDAFTLPTLPLVNVFVSLFFNSFMPQAPVLHRPTLDVNALPPALLAIIMAIGSCYSRLRHTRRFGIIICDRTRQNLSSLIQKNNGLMREPLVIYAAALVCFMGLWCGNKRAFELSEAFRAVVVTYIRRLPDANSQKNHAYQNNNSGHAASAAQLKSSSAVHSHWLDWARRESHKRLRWFVYMIDAQFPAVLGMSGMLTIADTRKWECPCDEEFWTITTARSWRNRLGSASEPSCPIFGSLTSLLVSSSEQSNESGIPVLLPNVNAWSANLLIITAMQQVFNFQETLAVLRTYGEEFMISAESSNASGSATHLLAMLEVWNTSYNQQSHIYRLDTTSSHLQRCSSITYHLARLYLVFPVSDIQECLGRSGHDDSKAAMSRLTAWIAQCPGQAERALEDACTCISIIMRNNGECDPYDLIGLFLCHVVIWSFAHTASLNVKEDLLRGLREQQSVAPTVIAVVEAGFTSGGGDDPTPDAPQLVFRHAIQSLVQFGTWGASSNLALLLHLHPGFSFYKD